MSTLHIDFETRSAVDLKAAGVEVYSKDPSTDIWCMAYAFGDGPVNLWTPSTPAIAVSNVKDYVKKGDTVVAHNANFELEIWNNILAPRYGFPPLALEQLDDTMARAYAMALPGSLEMAAAAVGLDVSKDMAGRRLMLQMARPRRVNEDGTFVWWDDEDRKARLYAYCKTDVEVERALDKRLLPLSKRERELWLLDQRINARGIHIDKPAAAAAIKVVDSAKKRLDRTLSKLTGGAVRTCNQVANLTLWVEEQGVEIAGLAKADITALLDRDDLPARVREALLLRQQAAKSSTAKLKAMLGALSDDNRVRGILQYHGASTGRWAGRKIQVQNFPRPELKQHEIEAVLGLLGG